MIFGGNDLSLDISFQTVDSHLMFSTQPSHRNLNLTVGDIIMADNMSEADKVSFFPMLEELY